MDKIKPNHYKGDKRDCIDEMLLLFGIEEVKAFCRCNIYKYKYRAERKNGQEDLGKAEEYMDILESLEHKEGE